MLVKAFDPSVPPAPAFSDTEPSVSVPVPVVIVFPLTVVGVTAPSEMLIAGVVVGLATDPETPFAVVTETLVTPVPGVNEPDGQVMVPLEIEQVAALISCDCADPTRASSIKAATPYLLTVEPRKTRPLTCR